MVSRKRKQDEEELVALPSDVEESEDEYVSEGEEDVSDEDEEAGDEEDPDEDADPEEDDEEQEEDHVEKTTKETERPSKKRKTATNPSEEADAPASQTAEENGQPVTEPLDAAGGSEVNDKANGKDVEHSTETAAQSNDANGRETNGEAVSETAVKGVDSAPDVTATTAKAVVSGSDTATKEAAVN